MRKQIAILLGAGLLQLNAHAGTDANGNKTVQTTTEEAPEFNNWITLGLGGFSVDGDAPNFKHRHWLNDDVFGGIEDLHWEPDLGKTVSLRVDGHALPGTEDYLADVELTVTDIGYVKVGYHNFRTWYDGHGGYFPPNGLFFDLYDNDFSVDREDFFVEVGLRVPKWPELTLRYERQTRDGTKDSTSWGDTALTGLPGPNNVRNIVPSFLNLDDMRDVFTIDLKHTIGPVEGGVGLRWEDQSSESSRNIHRQPGAPADRFLTQRDHTDYDLFSVHTYWTARLGKKFQLSLAYMYTTLDSDVSGSRIYGTTYDPIFDPLYARRQQRDEGFLNLMGGSELEQHVLTLSGAWRPADNWVIIPAFRFEHNDMDSFTSAVETNVATNGPLIVTTGDVQAEAQRKFDTATESLEVRYTGIKKWSFYAKGEWTQEDLTQNERDFELEDELPFLLIGRDTDGNINVQKYVLGTNWYPQSWLNLAAQYYKKIWENDYGHPFDTTSNAPPSGDRYPAFLRNQDFDVDDFNIRVTWRPLPNFTCVSRYDFQNGTTDTRGDFLGTVQSAEITAHILGESITWNPLPRLYLQGAIHYVWNKTDTPADEQLPNVVLDMHNDYWNGSVTAGFAISDKTDLQVNYFYYRADNFQDNSLFGQPYGSDDEEHAITAMLSHQFTPQIRGSFRYGYFSNRTPAYGGNHDYDAHLFGASLQYRF